MAEIVNLRRVRKEKERRERAAQAHANRRRFGRTKAEKVSEEHVALRRHHELDGKKLERDEDGRGKP